MDDMISRQAAIDAIMSVKRTDNIKSVAMLIMDLPSAEPQERTGEWIHDGSHWANRWICDRCKYKLFGVKTKFCPNCGSYNGGEA